MWEAACASRVTIDTESDSKFGDQFYLATGLPRIKLAVFGQTSDAKLNDVCIFLVFLCLWDHSKGHAGGLWLITGGEPSAASRWPSEEIIAPGEMQHSTKLH